MNLDVVERDDVHPDVIVDVDGPLPYPDGSAERVYAGHVLEHMPWPDTLAFVGELQRVLASGGELLVVGPDVLRTIHRWRDGLEPDFMLHTVLEYHDANTGFVSSDWPNARHWWNCWEQRVVDLLRLAGYAQVTPVVPPDHVVQDGWLAPWPNVGAAPWWCVVHALAP